MNLSHCPSRLLRVNPTIVHAQRCRRPQQETIMLLKNQSKYQQYLFVMVKAYRRLVVLWNSYGRIFLIIGAHEKLHAQPIWKIRHLLHLAKIATPTPQDCHPQRQLAFFIFLGLMLWSEHDKLIPTEKCVTNFVKWRFWGWLDEDDVSLGVSFYLLNRQMIARK